jgi:hypothetical protein
MHESKGRRVALVQQKSLILLDERYTSLYDLVWSALLEKRSLTDLSEQHKTGVRLFYEAVYTGRDPWKILPSFDHPHDPMHCLVSGTGLTHRASAENRASMHRKLQAGEDVSDSMKMYLWGEEGGKPAKGKVGVQPEWFYKGNGTILRGHLEALEIPAYALDGGEEPEIAGVYVVDSQGLPVRVGMTIANEFSDHVMEQQNYLYLAPSKLRNCAIGPELVLAPVFSDVKGAVGILREGKTIWEKEIRTGEKHITHSLANLEYHHFKYEQHRIPGQVHIHFYGAFGLSFSEGIRLVNGDEMAISMEGFGRPLINSIRKRDQPVVPPGVRELE